MCGRYVSATPPDELAKYFGALAPPPEHALSPNHNVAPTQTVYALRERSGARSLDTLHWGLVPFWAKDPKIGNRMINARAETVAHKNAFRVPFARRRCIIPADGFYEWQRLEGSKRKQPMFISRPDGEPFAFAGLWEKWRDDNNLDADGEPLELHSCTVITCEANDAMAEIHGPDAGGAAARRLGPLAGSGPHRRRGRGRAAGAGAFEPDPDAPGVHRGEQRPQQRRPPHRASRPDRN